MPYTCVVHFGSSENWQEFLDERLQVRHWRVTTLDGAQFREWDKDVHRLLHEDNWHVTPAPDVELELPKDRRELRQCPPNATQAHDLSYGATASPCQDQALYQQILRTADRTYLGSDPVDEHKQRESNMKALLADASELGWAQVPNQLGEAEGCALGATRADTRAGRAARVVFNSGQSTSSSG